MVIIRLARAGAKKKPFYRVVVADQRFPRDGRFIEQVGTYDPKKAEHGLKLQLDRIAHWRLRGAQATKTVDDLIVVAQSAAPAA